MSLTQEEIDRETRLHVARQRAEEEESRELFRCALPHLVQVATWSASIRDQAGRHAAASMPPQEWESDAMNLRRNTLENLVRVREELDAIERILIEPKDGDG